HLFGIDFRQVADQALPVIPFILAAPDLALTVAQIHTDRLQTANRHALTFDSPPRLGGREAAVLSYKGSPTITTAEYRRFAVRAGTRPLTGTVHRENPDAVRITWMYHN